MTAPFACGEGFYSQKGAHECTLCQSGYKCSGTTMTATTYEDASNVCDGYNCEVWVHGTSSEHKVYEQSECEEGHYCPTGSKLQVPCPRGTYRDHSSGDTPTEITGHCLDSPTTFYADREGMTLAMIQPDNVCRAGYKCEAGSRSKFSEPCPPGTYQPADG